MRVFVYEYVCGGGMAGKTAPESLRREGRAMLAAVTEDFRRCPGVRVAVTLEEGMNWAVPSNVETHSIRLGEEVRFRSLARAADFTLVIAPECDGLLAERCAWVEEEGGCLLGPSAAAVRRTGDKLGLGWHLLAGGVPTPACSPWPGTNISFPAVCKPRFGAGSQATFLVRSEDELRQAIDAARAERAGEMIVQPFVPGQAVSVAFLLGGGQTIALPPATQDWSTDGRFQYRGGQVPIAPELVHRAQALAECAVHTVEGLRGYVGVDLVLGETADGDDVIEINPRLTTSYVGLRALAEFNLAEAMLMLATDGVMPEMRWKEGCVWFKADGSIS